MLVLLLAVQDVWDVVKAFGIGGAPAVGPMLATELDAEAEAVVRELISGPALLALHETDAPIVVAVVPKP